MDLWSAVEKEFADRQGLTLVHVGAQLEHIRDTPLGRVGLRGAQRQLRLS